MHTGMYDTVLLYSTEFLRLYYDMRLLICENTKLAFRFLLARLKVQSDKIKLIKALPEQKHVSIHHLFKIIWKIKSNALSISALFHRPHFPMINFTLDARNGLVRRMNVLIIFMFRNLLASSRWKSFLLNFVFFYRYSNVQ